MNTALILAAGVGQRMRNGGLPKQFLKLMGKPIIIYTLEKFERCSEIDNIVIACHGGYIDYMQELVALYQIKKVSKVIVGGNDRQSSVIRGLQLIESSLVDNGSAFDNHIVVIHDGVRPLVETAVIIENIQAAKRYGCAVTVHQVKESVVITEKEDATIDECKERDKTYTLTSPQSFQLQLIQEAYRELTGDKHDGMPLLDAAMVYAKTKGSIHLIKEQGPNIKITTPEDFYYLKAILDLEENKYIFGL